MKWIRYDEGFKSIHLAMGASLVFMLFALIYNQVLLGACFAAVFAISSFQNIYYLNVGKGLKLLPSQKQNRYLIDSVNDLILEFENGKYPIWNGTLVVSIQDTVKPIQNKMEYVSGILDISVPFVARSHEKVSITIPLKGNKRGISRITRMYIEIPHLFSDGAIMLELDEVVKQSQLVYPKVEPYNDKLQPAPFLPGEVEQRRSLFQDAYQPIGTRDYVSTDRFDQIHWTATARMQKLQTKQYLPVTAQSVLLVMNAIEKMRSPDDFEKKIEKLASYADYCTRNDIPYSVIVNIQTFGSVPFVHIPTGTGKVQYQKTLEMLAKIGNKNAKIPYEHVLMSLEAKGLLPPTVVLITHDPSRYDPFVKKWSRYNHVIVDSFYEGSVENWDMNSSKEIETA